MAYSKKNVKPVYMGASQPHVCYAKTSKRHDLQESPGKDAFYGMIGATQPDIGLLT